mgnify:CR=1 FL=1
MVGERVPQASSIGRELQFLVSHGVHHLAMVAVLRGVDVEEEPHHLRAAGAELFAVFIGETGIVPDLHGHADHLATGLLEQSRGNRGIYTAAHGNDNSFAWFNHNGYLQMFAEIIIPSCFIRNSEYSIQYQEENLKMRPGFWTPVPNT